MADLEFSSKSGGAALVDQVPKPLAVDTDRLPDRGHLVDSRQLIYLQSIPIQILLSDVGRKPHSHLATSSYAGQDRRSRRSVAGVGTDPPIRFPFIPSEVSKIDFLAGELAPLLEMDEKAIVRKVAERRSRKYEPVAIRRDLSFPAVCIIEESSELFPGVIYQLDQTRTYYYGKLLCHFDWLYR